MTRMTDDWFRRMAAGGGGWTAAVLRPVLWCASLVYESIIRFRNARYDRSHSRALRVDAPVISVGNLTVGGTGKTPVVLDLIGRIRSLGRKPAVIARGYGAASGGPNDEQRLIQRRGPEVVYIANPDRVAGARDAIERREANALILDDGFQHRRLRRDLDIVLIDATLPFGHEVMLPRGLLREPVDSLSRCGLVIITRCDQIEPVALERIEAVIRKHAPQQPLVRCRHAPTGLAHLTTGGTRTTQQFDTPVYLISGIGNPAAFEQTAKSIGLDICGSSAFGDHHLYDAGDVSRICAAAQNAGAEAIVTTEKDAVKLERLNASWPLDVWVLGVAIEYLDGGAAVIDDSLKRVIG